MGLWVPSILILWVGVRVVLLTNAIKPNRKRLNMFEYLFPIFCFGVVVTGIVAKGLLMAADVANSPNSSDGRK